MGPQPPIVPANYLINKAIEAGKPLTSLALQKLLYFLHGHAYARLGYGAVNEPFQAWQYGPVIPSLYKQLMVSGSSPITMPIYDSQNRDLASADPNLAKVADKVWDAYGNLSGNQLVSISMADGSPWNSTYNPQNSDSAMIPEQSIRQYFQEREAATK